MMGPARQEVRPFTDKQIEAGDKLCCDNAAIGTVSNIASRVIAIENLRDF
jgi:hypothetical protein